MSNALGGSGLECSGRACVGGELYMEWRGVERRNPNRTEKDRGETATEGQGRMNHGALQCLRIGKGNAMYRRTRRAHDPPGVSVGAGLHSTAQHSESEGV